MLETTPTAFQGIPCVTCPRCEEPMHVVTIKRMLAGEGAWDITFCCSSCDHEIKAAISPPIAAPLLMANSLARL